MNGPNFELIRELAAIIGGIPADRINLSVQAQAKPGIKRGTEAHHCGTFACAMGWAG